MMQTPYLPKKLFGDDFDKVYEPAEDSFLLLDALEQDLDMLKKNVNICLECGSGSGIIVTALAQALNSKIESTNRTLPTHRRLILATDLNLNACETTKKCASYHNQNENIQVIRTNLAESLVDRLENSVDLLVFNPPYVPTSNDETKSSSRAIDAGPDATPTGQLHLSWAGGFDGRQLINTFLGSFVPRLLSKPSGVAYMIALDKNNVHELLDYLVDEHKISGKIVMERQAGIEHLYVLKYEWLK